MKEYTIHCNEEQLRLLCSAVELQMRVRLGQGFALTENLLDITSDRYGDKRELLEPILSAILRKMVEKSYGRLYDHITETRTEERDMWISLEKALGRRDNEIALGKWGLMKIEEGNGELVSNADELKAQIAKDLEEHYQKWGFTIPEVVTELIDKYLKGQGD